MKNKEETKNREPKMAKKNKKVFDLQNQHWEAHLSSPDMFGVEPSETGRMALDIFEEQGAVEILELGGGQGRDTFLFAAANMNVRVLDYSEKGVKTIDDKAWRLGMDDKVTTLQFDLREPIPFPAASFDACYAHMLFCMALTEDEIASLIKEVHRVLRSGGTLLYTVRNTEDPQFGTGTYFGEGIYETEGGFIVHFFDREKVERLAEGFEIASIEQFEESSLPKRLFRVVLRKD
ncbi:MAG: class I SAM-dependent methyltransferase [Syntrophorhabdaceae bacterium]